MSGGRCQEVSSVRSLGGDVCLLAFTCISILVHSEVTQTPREQVIDAFDQSEALSQDHYTGLFFHYLRLKRSCPNPLYCRFHIHVLSFPIKKALQQPPALPHYPQSSTAHNSAYSMSPLMTWPPHRSAHPPSQQLWPPTPARHSTSP